MIKALSEQRRAAGVAEDAPPMSISQMLEGDRTPAGKLANKSPEAMNLVKQEITAIKDEAVPNSPRGGSFGYSPDFNLTKKSLSNRRERIISLTYDRFRRHLTLPPGQRPVLHPTTKNVETHAIAFARLTMTEKLQIYPDLEPGWRTSIVAALTPEHQAGLARNLAFQKSGTAPIEDLTWENTLLALQTLRQNIEHWRPDFDREAFRDTGILNRALLTLSEEEKTDVRLYHTHHVCDLIRKYGSAALSPSVIYFDKVPVGIMTMSASGTAPNIAHLVTHPGSVHAGGALIEHAVNTSVAWGTHGKIQLLADNPASMSVYAKMGFVAQNGPRMMLDPSTSDKWQQVDGKWRLTSHIDDKFLIGYSEENGL